MAYDLVIRNGLVVDGSGAPPERVDVGVEGGRIVRVGRIRDRAKRVIDAEGHVVTPGFVDGHTHMDAQVMWDEMGSCSCYHGVTSVVMGNCGFTLAPVSADGRDLVLRNLERAEDIPRETLQAGLEWSWETFPEYLDAVDRRPKAINYSAYLGHSALRTWVMGESAFTDEADEADLELMCRTLEEAIRAGAYGFTTSRSPNHQTSDDRPVASRVATWDEVCALVNVMGDLGAGVFEIAGDFPRDPDQVLAIRRQYADLAASTQVPFTFAVGEQKSFGQLEAIVSAGGRALGQTHCRGVSTVMSFRTALPFDKLPAWKELRSEPLEDQRRLLVDPEIRRRLVDEARHGEYSKAVGAEARRPEYERMLIYRRPLPPHATVADEAAALGIDPAELMIDLGLETDFRQLFVQSLAPVSDEAILNSLKHPRTAMTFSDSGAHVSQISDCSIQTYLLSYWVRDRQAFTLEEAVRMITLAPATGWGFADRGLVREGFVADLNVFDPATVGPELPVVADDLPGASRRLVQKASGFLATIVAGEVIVERGVATEARPGRLIRGALARR